MSLCKSSSEVNFSPCLLVHIPWSLGHSSNSKTCFGQFRGPASLPYQNSLASSHPAFANTVNVKKYTLSSQLPLINHSLTPNSLASHAPKGVSLDQFQSSIPGSCISQSRAALEQFRHTHTTTATESQRKRVSVLDHSRTAVHGLLLPHHGEREFMHRCCHCRNQHFSSANTKQNELALQLLFICFSVVLRRRRGGRQGRGGMFEPVRKEGC